MSEQEIKIESKEMHLIVITTVDPPSSCHTSRLENYSIKQKESFMITRVVECWRQFINLETRFAEG